MSEALFAEVPVDNTAGGTAAIGRNEFSGLGSKWLEGHKIAPSFHALKLVYRCLRPEMAEENLKSVRQ